MTSSSMMSTLSRTAAPTLWWIRSKKSGAQGLVLFMQQFCDPEEMEYPYLKKALDAADIPHIKLGVDQQMRDFGQASTAIQAFADVL